MFKIQITKEYQLHCSFINEQNEEIKVINSEFITPSIRFYTNTISLFKEEKENTIHFIQQWLEQPEEYQTYSIQFQNKNYELLPEIFFSIIIHELKKKIEKQFIIKDTLIHYLFLLHLL